MSNNALSFDTGHQDAIHSAAMDYYGRILATASSDSTVKVFQVSGDQHNHLADLSLHEGPVWKVAWANPKFNLTLLASCGYDRRIIIWKDNGGNKWQAMHVDQETHRQSVNCVEFAPPEYGQLLLLAGSADAHVSVHAYDMHTQRFKLMAKLHGHVGGVNAVSWSTQHRVQRFVTGGSDGKVIVWRRQHDDKWATDAFLTENGHTDWVRDVAWAPSPSQSAVALIASCGEDKCVKLWMERGGQWSAHQTIKLDQKAWSVSWSALGNVLAISTSSQVLLYKEDSDGRFVEIK